jgi:CRISPR/Cas system-associated exonuclease Cas4 (RecB family)
MNFTWSFSSLKEYVNCPKQYQEVKVLKRFYKAPTQAMTYGNEVHKALEDYVNSGLPLAKNYQYAKETLDHLISIDGIKLPEHRMALNKDREPCSYGKDYWVRGIADLVIIDGADAFIIDYKTGSNKFADVKQLFGEDYASSLFSEFAPQTRQAAPQIVVPAQIVMAMPAQQPNIIQSSPAPRISDAKVYQRTLML